MMMWIRMKLPVKCYLVIESGKLKSEDVQTMSIEDEDDEDDDDPFESSKKMAKMDCRFDRKPLFWRPTTGRFL